MPETVHHRINAEGTRVICLAPEDAYCRRRPLCDTESWHGLFRDNHNPAHDVLPGQECWMIEWINTGFLDDSSTDGDPGIEHARVKLEFHGIDIGVTWRLAD